ncbi:MAG: pentapeptide repeat-containing protein [Candidatus Uhrbacteria bacterium]
MSSSERGPSPEEMSIPSVEQPVVTTTETVEKPIEVQEKKRKMRLDREGVKARLEAGENLENYDLSNLDLAGLDFREGVSFRGSDLRGTLFFHKESEDGSDPEVKTSIKGADFTEATFAILERKPVFVRVEAEGAKFGYTESLLSRLKRLEEPGELKTAENSGGLFGFNGCEGNFKGTTWGNIDFGGDTGFGATFYGADFSGAVIDGCDLSGIDLSETEIKNIKIINPVISSKGFVINEDQIETVVSAISFSDNRQASWERDKAVKSSRDLLENVLKIEISQL